jgi:UDP-glucose 4-epimerase
MNIARALIGERDISLQTVGIRPGEKLHEILISEEEIHHCVRRGDYYAIQPMLPEVRQQREGEANALSAEYSSADAVLDLPGTAALLRKHRLMIEDSDWSNQTELLR